MSDRLCFYKQTSVQSSNMWNRSMNICRSLTTGIVLALSQSYHRVLAECLQQKRRNSVNTEYGLIDECVYKCHRITSIFLFGDEVSRRKCKGHFCVWSMWGISVVVGGSQREKTWFIFNAYFIPWRKHRRVALKQNKAKI